MNTIHTTISYDRNGVIVIEYEEIINKSFFWLLFLFSALQQLTITNIPGTDVTIYRSGV